MKFGIKGVAAVGGGTMFSEEDLPPKADQQALPPKTGYPVLRRWEQSVIF